MKPCADVDRRPRHIGLFGIVGVAVVAGCGVDGGLSDADRAPLISSLTASNITTTSVEISWRTDEPSEAAVEYGATESYGASTPLGERATLHHVALTGLAPATPYHYRVMSVDRAGNLAASPDQTFSTVSPTSATANPKPPTAPGPFSITSATRGNGQVAITWSAAANALRYNVRYGTSSGSYPTSYPGAASCQPGSPCTVAGLTNGTRYYFMVIADNASGTTSASGEASAVPAASGPFTPIRVVAGQTSSVTDAQGTVWAADYGSSGGSAGTNFGQAVQGTASPQLYVGQRFGAFSYSFNVPAGAYLVTLKLTENYVSAAGKRLFDVSINGTKVLDDFDIYASSGGKWKAIDRTFSVTLGSAGALTISFTRGPIDDAKVDAIEIVAG